MSTNLTYLASPYSKYPHGTHKAWVEVCAKAAQLMEAGENVFCPIAHTHPIEWYGMYGMAGRHDGDWWLQQDFAVLAHCSKLVVYKMPGWDESYGVQKEIEFANKNNIPVSFLEYEPRN